VSLRASGVRAAYERLEVLSGVDLAAATGELVAVIGANGAGKTTLLRVLSGLLRATGGTVEVYGEDVTRLPAERLAAMGVVHVPEGRLVFPSLSVRENLLLGGFPRRRQGGRALAADVDRVVGTFPRLVPRLGQAAGSLSGGEQQMLAIARGLMARPRLMMLDEPSLGLAPRVTQEIFATLARLRAEGELTLLLVEQNARAALRVADRVYVMDRGRVLLEGRSADLLADPRVQAAYLGGGYAPEGAAVPEVPARAGPVPASPLPVPDAPQEAP